jgi:DNA replication protein DnaC
MDSGKSPAISKTSSNDDAPKACALCGNPDAICGGMGVIRYNVPVEHAYFGKLFRCPNHRLELDSERQDKLLKISNLSAYADKTFQNFRIRTETLTHSEYESLDHAYKVAWNYAEKLDGWLLLEGRYGCGKTHLASAVGNFRLQRGDPVLFMTVPDLLDHLRSTYAPTSDTGYDETFERLKTAPLLILDDLGAENQSAWALEKLFQLFNQRYALRLPTIVTTNTDIDQLDGRVRSRLMDESLVHRVTIVAPDYRTSVTNERERLLSNLALYHKMTFKTFDTTKNLLPNEQANLKRVLDAAVDYAKHPRGWLVLGSIYPACGKTHLAAAIANYHHERHNNVIFMTVPDVLDYLRVTYTPGSSVTFDQRFQDMRETPLLVLDDLGAENPSRWAQEKLFQLIDYRYVAELPTVITTGKPLKDLDARIITRLIDERRSIFFSIDVLDYPSRMRRK